MENTWNGNQEVFRAYMLGKTDGDGKAPKGSTKNKKNYLSFPEASDTKNECMGAVLNENIIDISFDSEELSSSFWEMAEANNWDCLILENLNNKHIHSFWKDTKGRIKKGGADIKLACGLIADIHKGFTYIPLRVHGDDRVMQYEPEHIQEVPEELLTVKTEIDLLNMKEGDGRDSDLFRYENIIVSQVTDDESILKRIIQNINQFVFKEPLSDDDIERITRPEAIPKNNFYNGSTFMFDRFASYLMANYHIIKINGQLHIYQDGIYTNDMKAISNVMRSLIPNIKKNQKSEVIDFLYDMSPLKETTEARFIVFNNGVLDLNTNELMPLSPEYIITNKIPWNYCPAAYDELTDATLNKLACGDASIRALLEECIGYCMLRSNLFNKAFILTGEKANGKSTFLKVMTKLLGSDNISSLDLKNLGDRFSKASLLNKLANIGDDISDEFVADASLFKKITDGGRIQAERKGLDPFEFNPYCKLIFSANDIPRIRDKTGAVLRRLVIIPFSAVFSETDADYNPNIVKDLTSPEAIQYLAVLGVQGLNRILSKDDKGKYQGFTISAKVDAEKEAYSLANNSVLGFIAEYGEGNIINEWTKEVYTAYQYYCNDSGNQPYRQAEFSKQINQALGTHISSGHKIIVGKRTTVNCFVR